MYLLRGFFLKVVRRYEYKNNMTNENHTIQYILFHHCFFYANLVVTIIAKLNNFAKFSKKNIF